MNQQEQQYLHLLENILRNGSVRQDRTGVGTKSIFGTQLRFSLENNTLPLITTKKVFFRGIVEELLWFIRGETDSKKLEDKGVNIWKGNTSREFLDKRGLNYLPEGSIGKGYGYQWRNFGGTDVVIGVDQLSNALRMIKEDPNSRKIIVSAWNPQQLNEMALEPCHTLFQFQVDNGKLNLHWYQRSLDTLLGAPFNIASYATLTLIMAKAAGLEGGDLILSGGDSHLYLSHLEQAKEQISREPYQFPKLNIKRGISSMEDIERLQWEDFELIGYQYHPAIKADMAI